MEKIIKEALKRFESVWGEAPKGSLKHKKREEIKDLFHGELLNTYLAGRVCKQNEIDYHFQEVGGKIEGELSEINKQYANADPIIRDTVFGITHRIESFINHQI